MSLYVMKAQSHPKKMGCVNRTLGMLKGSLLKARHAKAAIYGQLFREMNSIFRRLYVVLSSTPCSILCAAVCVANGSNSLREVGEKGTYSIVWRLFSNLPWQDSSTLTPLTNTHLVFSRAHTSYLRKPGGIRYERHQVSSSTYLRLTEAANEVRFPI